MGRTTRLPGPCDGRPAPSRPVVSPPTDAEHWKRLMNFLFVHEEDALFRWLRGVRRAVEEAEERERAA